MKNKNKITLKTKSTMIKNGNYFLNIYNEDEHIRVSERWIDDNLNTAIPEYPEMIDIKITNKCNVGCKWCYQDSQNEIDSEKNNFKFIKEILNQIPSYVELAIGGGDVLEVSFIDSLLKEIERFSSKNFTINYKSLLINKELNRKNLEKIVKNSSAIGISINNAKEIKKTLFLFKKLGFSKEIDKICFHIIPDIIKYEDLEMILSEISKTNTRVLLLGYKVFGRGITYQKKSNKHDINKIQRLLNDLTNNYNTFIKVDTKFSKDYELQNININEGEFSCNVDAPLKTVSPSSWRNKEQFYYGNFIEAFQNIRENQGFDKFYSEKE